MEISQNSLNEKLREAACFGDLFLLVDLIREGADVNSRNSVNGWTALHWAAYRNNENAVNILLQYGADKKIKTLKEEFPGNLSSNVKIQEVLGTINQFKEQFQLPFTPNYLKNLAISISKSKYQRNEIRNKPISDSNEELVFKIRLAESTDPDFIEIEIPKSQLTMEKLKKICARELEVEDSIFFIRKLPNTKLRSDKDVKRLKDYQELEVVLSKNK